MRLNTAFTRIVTLSAPKKVFRGNYSNFAVTPASLRGTSVPQKEPTPPPPPVTEIITAPNNLPEKKKLNLKTLKQKYRDSSELQKGTAGQDDEKPEDKQSFLVEYV